jgi:hypothetical protein
MTFPTAQQALTWFALCLLLVCKVQIHCYLHILVSPLQQCAQEIAPNGSYDALQLLDRRLRCCRGRGSGPAAEVQSNSSVHVPFGFLQQLCSAGIIHFRTQNLPQSCEGCGIHGSQAIACCALSYQITLFAQTVQQRCNKSSSLIHAMQIKHRTLCRQLHACCASTPHFVTCPLPEQMKSQSA